MSSNADLLFYIEGEQAEETVAELQQLIGKLFGQTPRCGMPAANLKTDEKTDPALIVGIATLVFAIPPGIDSALNLAERLALKEKVQRLIAFAQQRKQSRIRIKRRDRIEPLLLDEAQLSELLDQFTNT